MDEPWQERRRKAEAPLLRMERTDDFAAVESLVREAFGGSGEEDLVRRIRTAADAVSLVAEEAGVVVGHILLTPASVEGGAGAATGRAFGLGPMAVHPSRQRRGIGGALVRAGLAACAGRGAALVFVLGHPAYYPRFGFLPAAPRGLHYGDGTRDAAFFVYELRPGAAADVRGRVSFHRAFDGL